MQRRGRRQNLDDADDFEQSDKDSLEGEFRNLNPLQKKPAPKSRKKVKGNDFGEIEHADPDPVRRRQFANGQHVPVRLSGVQGNMDINIQYDDGQVRKFGQQKHFDQKVISVSKSGPFIYEFPEAKQVSRKVQQEDTRSLFDDPFLQQQRLNYTPRILQKMQNNIAEREEEQLAEESGVQWRPIRVAEDVPESFYMKQVFDRGQSGPRNIDKNTIHSEYDAFRLFFDHDIYEQILKHTRERYQQRVEEAIYAYIHGFNTSGFKARKPQFQHWQFNEFELEAYFAVQIFFGIVRLSNQRDYWKSQAGRRQNFKSNEMTKRRKYRELAQEKMDRYSQWVTQRMSSVISFERYKTIRACLNISGAEALKMKGRDPIWKIRSFLNQMNDKFSRYYYPGEFITIDEGMIPFAGKVQFKVYNPDKPTKWGIKEYLLCDAANTYTFQVRLYHGQTMWNQDFKQTVFAGNEEDTQSRTMELVLQMCKDYEHRGHKIVMDNYYTSWQLFREMRNRGIGAVGTIRHNRTGLTKRDLTSKHFQQIYNQYHYAFYLNQSNELILMYFQGTSEKEIALMSNFLDNSLNEQHIWDISKQHYYVPHLKAPYMMYVYNKFKGGVDRRNSYVVKFRSRFPVKKWWQSVFERLFETAILNAFIVFRNFNPDTNYRNRGQMREFRINLMYQFAERFKSFDSSEQGPKKTPHQYIAKLQPHTFIQGEEIVHCIECGKETKTFCQECTILRAEIVALCHDTSSIKCQRFHEFQDFDLDKHKEIFDKRRGKVSHIPDFFNDVKKRTNDANGDIKQFQQSQSLKNESNQPLIQILQNISEQVKQEQNLKQEQAVKKEQQFIPDEDCQVIHQPNYIDYDSESFLDESIPDSQQLYAELQEMEDQNHSKIQKEQSVQNQPIEQNPIKQSQIPSEFSYDQLLVDAIPQEDDPATYMLKKLQQRQQVQESPPLSKQQKILQKSEVKLTQPPDMPLIQTTRPEVSSLIECLQNILKSVKKDQQKQ